MARFLLVLKPNGSAAEQPTGHRQPEAILSALEPVLQALNAEVDQRKPAHLGALLKQGGEIQRMQMFADVQALADGRALELVLLSREAMGLRAPQTLQVFERLVALIEQHMPEMTMTFRSDRDGPLP